MARQSVFLLAVLALFIYVGARIASGVGTIPTGIFLAILFAGIGGFRTIHALKNAWLRRVLLTIVHLEMAFLSFMLAFILIRDVVFFPISFWRPDISDIAFGLSGTLFLLALSAGALVLGILIARAGPRVVRVQIPIKHLPKEFEGFSIAQISDLHVSGTTAPSFVERVVEKTLDLKPSMVALTGDIGDGNIEESRAMLGPLSRLTSETPHGAFYVTGNHEFYWNGPTWIEAFRSLGMKTLLNSHETISVGASQMLIAGILDPASQMAFPGGKPDPKLAMERDGSTDGTKNFSPKILLAHQPGIAAVAADLGFDLQLSGHTHAGQFFPWTLIISRVHEFSNGLGKKAKMWVYVNPGTGSWGPPVRLGSRTEITLLSLTREG